MELHQNVFARINFLLGLGLLILIAFYYAGAYLLSVPLSASAPEWVRPGAGVAILAAMGITVQLLSVAMGSLRGVALYTQGERAGMRAYLSQSAIVLGHIGTIYFATRLILDGIPVADAQLLCVAALYVAGVALAVHEWRQRRLARH